jgi:hypothetical protein
VTVVGRREKISLFISTRLCIFSSLKGKEELLKFKRECPHRNRVLCGKEAFEKTSFSRKAIHIRSYVLESKTETTHLKCQL